MSPLFSEILEGLRRFPLASLLGWRDTISAHRRSFIGPTWIFIQTFLWVFFIGTLFGGLLSEGNNVDYLVYVAVGMVVFNFSTLIIADASNTFIRDAGLIKNIPVPPSVYIMRVGTKAVFTMIFEIPVILIAFALKGFVPTLEGMGFALIGIIVTLFSLMGAAFGLAAIGARIKDLVPAISVANRLAFFATPIFWLRSSSDPVREFLVTYNPLAYYMKIIRAPLLGMEWNAMDWWIVLAMSVVFWVVGLALYGNTRDRLAALV